MKKQMKASELLQLAIDNHLSMDGDICILHTTPFLCNAVKIATWDAGASNELRDAALTAIHRSINGRETYTQFLRSDCNIPAIYENETLAKRKFIQFMRKRRAEFIISQLQARGE